MTATKEQPFVNSLGMKFVPVPITGGRSVLFCVWQTRVQDFRAFATDRIGNSNWDYQKGPEPMMLMLKGNGWSTRGRDYGWQKCGFEQTDTHPVVCVSWMDAKAFCAWLTKKERLPDGWSYRLPTDAEWSTAVGLHETITGTPKDKDSQIFGVYPWGTQWPPPDGAGNYGGVEERTADMPQNAPVIDGYRDKFPRTSPVGSFSANQYGLYDMGGNVKEHCEDLSEGKSDHHVCRGASWHETSPRELLSSNRKYTDPDHRGSDYGFRCVLAPASSTPPAVK